MQDVGETCENAIRVDHHKPVARGGPWKGQVAVAEPPPSAGNRESASREGWRGGCGLREQADVMYVSKGLDAGCPARAGNPG